MGCCCYGQQYIGKPGNDSLFLFCFCRYGRSGEPALLVVGSSFRKSIYTTTPSFLKLTEGHVMEDDKALLPAPFHVGMIFYASLILLEE